ncbi:hypothetical protein LCGC14_3142030 [marine sediment metagenome]|uniref:Uncharacterized protein n=1 Tax=marine sediment metagenome TaxID=412755 RepID=A0A0F8WKH5_9ZZZZ
MDISFDVDDVVKVVGVVVVVVSVARALIDFGLSAL